jgi:hypothetical protein
MRETVPPTHNRRCFGRHAFGIMSMACLLMCWGMVPKVFAGVSSSKIGPHVLGSTTSTGVQTILDACPRVAKWMTPLGGAAQQIANYRSRCPGGIVVIRVYVSNGDASYSVSDNPQSSAENYWSKMQGGLAGIPPCHIDWLEGPNEVDNVPDWTQNFSAANWYASFCSRLADLMNAAGYHPLLGSLPVGSPKLASESPEGVNYFKPIADALKQKSYLWGWSYHAYTPDACKDNEHEKWYSLRFRTTRDECGLANVPIIFTEGGFDKGGGLTDGWSDNVTKDQYLDWLRWFDSQICGDREVLGETIFQLGETDRWKSWNLGPIAGDFANFLQTTSQTCQAVEVDAGCIEEHAAGEDGASADDGPVADDGSTADDSLDAGSADDPSVADDDFSDLEPQVVGSCGCASVVPEWSFLLGLLAVGVTLLILNSLTRPKEF